MPLQTLQDGLARATVTGTTTAVSGAVARRMACAAGVIPAVLDGKSRVVELKFFGGLKTDEVAEVIGVAEITVLREWQKAKAWLYLQLNGTDP